MGRARSTKHPGQILSVTLFCNIVRSNTLIDACWKILPLAHMEVTGHDQLHNSPSGTRRDLLSRTLDTQCPSAVQQRDPETRVCHTLGMQ